MTALVERLRATLGAEAVAGSEAALTGHAVDGVLPGAVVYPESPEQVAEALALATAERWGVIPWGSGSGMGRGQVPARYDLALSLIRLTQIHDHDVANLTLTAAGGLSLAEANRHVGARQQMLPIGFPEATGTLGGIVAAGRIAPKRLLYGEVRDQLLGLRIALADGTLVRYGRKVLKNVAGYDMNKLFLGSQGLLGVVVETTFKLAALPDEERTLLATFAQADAAAAAAAELFRSQLLPSLLILLDASAVTQAQAGTAGVGHAGGGGGQGLSLLLGFEGRSVAVQRQLADAQALLRRHGAGEVAPGGRPGPELRHVLEAPAAVPGRPAALRLRLGVVPTAVLSTIARARATLTALGAAGTIVADYAAGQVYITLSGEADGPQAASRMVDAVAQLRAGLEAERGFLAVEGAAPAVKAALPSLAFSAGEAHLMQVLKQRFDPHAVLAPGRYPPGAA